MSGERWVATGALLAAAAVGLGAFAAHGLEGRLPADRLEVFEVGVRYHLTHAIGLILVGILAARWGGRAMTSVGFLLLVGTLLFSGGLYVWSLTGIRAAVHVVPWEGFAFLPAGSCSALLLCAVDPRRRVFKPGSRSLHGWESCRVLEYNDTSGPRVWRPGMSLTFRCSDCSHQYTVPAQMAGKWVRCKNCGATLEVPGVPPTPSGNATSGSPDSPSPPSKPLKRARPLSSPQAPEKIPEAILLPDPSAQPIPLGQPLDQPVVAQPAPLKAPASQHPLAHPVQQPALQPLRPASRPRITPSEGPSNQKAIFLAVGAVGAVLVIVVLMMVVVFSSDPGKNRQTAGAPSAGSSGNSSDGSASGSESALSAADKQTSAATARTGVVDFEREPVVQFGTVRKLPCEVPGVQWEEVSVTGKLGAPGSPGKLWVYVPSGRHESRSLGCVLIGPAGSRMIHGMELVMDDQAEHCPYVEKGFAVVAFEIDGALPDENPSNRQLRHAYDRFVAAAAGVVNARIALKYATSEMPEVDPNRVFVAGHSSAGTVALLCAEHVDGLAGCVAYAPCSDLEGFLAGFQNDVDEVIPSVRQYMVDGSPCAYAQRLRCPVMIFHAIDDEVVRLSESRRFVQLASSAGQNVTLQPGTRGGHYEAMIVEGIPEAIKWMNRTRPAASPTAPSPASSFARPETPPSARISPFSGTPSPSRGTVRAYVRIKILSYPSTGHPETIARQALRSLVWAEPDSIRIDRSANELVIGVSVMQVNTNTARIELEKVGFVVAGARFEPVRN